MFGHRIDVLIDARLAAYRNGGVARYATELGRRLPSVAPDLTIASVVNRVDVRNPRPTTRVFTPPHHRLERFSLGLELSLRAPRIIHSTDFILPLTIGPRRVVTVHDVTFLTHPELLAPAARHYYSQLERSLSAADAIITVSSYTANELLKLAGAEPSKVVTIPNGAGDLTCAANAEQAREVIRDRLPRPLQEQILGGRPIVLSVGTVEPRKRHQLLLAAMQHPELGRSEPRPLLVIAGQRGWECDEIVQEIERASARDDVVWLDRVDDDLLGALYRVATVFALASLDEGFGLTLLEAMNSGLPAIVSERGALPEVACGAAVLVAGEDPHKWADALSHLLCDERRRQELRTLGQRRAAELTWDATARKTADLYRELLRA